jgi:hypothetical protein
MTLIHHIYHFFDKLEDHIRAVLSTHKFIYTFIGGTGVVLFWRGVWHTADVLERSTWWGSVIFSATGSVVLSVIILLATGLFVSMFIGDSIIMSGIKKDKKVIDKTIDEVEDEKSDIKKTLVLITEVKKELDALEKKVRAQCEVK